MARHGWLVFTLPLAVFLLVGSLEPTSSTSGASAIGVAIPYSFYPWVYTLKITLTVAAVLFVLPGYRVFPVRVTLLAVIVGIVGAVIWIGLCSLKLEERLLGPVGLGWLIEMGARSAYNPFEQLAGGPFWPWAFLAVRLFGLAVVVPVIEEFFLRGFAMRFAMAADWWEVPFGKVNAAALLVGVAVPMLMHPAELVAAGVWFSLVTWLMVRTKSLWDCVAAHAVTNLLLGAYVVGGDLLLGQSHWQLI